MGFFAGELAAALHCYSDAGIIREDGILITDERIKGLLAATQTPLLHAPVAGTVKVFHHPIGSAYKATIIVTASVLIWPETPLAAIPATQEEMDDAGEELVRRSLGGAIGGFDLDIHVLLISIA